MAGFDIVEADDIVIGRVGQSAEACALRGHGAVHCAFAEQLRDTDLVVACGDRTLVKTCLGLGIATAATNRTD